MYFVSGASGLTAVSSRPASWTAPRGLCPSARTPQQFLALHASPAQRSNISRSPATSSSSNTVSAPSKGPAPAAAANAAAADIAQLLESAIGDESRFLEMTLRGRPGQNTVWRSVTVRPVLLRGKRQLQFSFFDGRQTTVKNFGSGDAQAELAAAMRLSLSSVQLRYTDEELNIQISRKGKPIIHTSKVAATASSTGSNSSAQDSQTVAVQLQHDRTKQLPISPSSPSPFLQKLGMQTSDGRIKADMQDKFTQINEFIKLLGHSGVLERWAPGQVAALPGLRPSSRLVQLPDMQGPESADQKAGAARTSDQPVCILDCGCGSSHLTFGTYHYLSNVLQVPARIMGVDTNAALMKRSNEHARALGLDEQQALFYTSPILEFAGKAPTRPDVVLALHACDTATDEALALGIKQGVSVIMAVPCCHKNLHRQMARVSPPGPLAPLMRHGIMKQRQIDMLTDTFRTQLLRIMGYKTDAMEFTSAEHTPRNLLLRAVKIQDGSPTGTAGEEPTDKMLADRHHGKVLRELLEEYDACKAAWGGVVPHLEVLLQPEMQELRSRLQ